MYSIFLILNKFFFYKIFGFPILILWLFFCSVYISIKLFFPAERLIKYGVESLSDDELSNFEVHYTIGGGDSVTISGNCKKIEGKYDMSPGNSALNGQSTTIQGLDLTVTGSSSDYKYKVNN